MSALNQLITYDQNLNYNKRPRNVIEREAAQELAILRDQLARKDGAEYLACIQAAEIQKAEIERLRDRMSELTAVMYDCYGILTASRKFPWGVGISYTLGRTSASLKVEQKLEAVLWPEPEEAK